tara:strand:+ start:164 stop:811 length:648 start_codon:yes stop_codon:yes gene_type:complete
MGVEDNQFQIENLNSNTSFFDWYTKTNDEIVSKLNKLKIYDIDVAGSLAEGISAERGTSGGHAAGFLNLGVADSIPHGLAISGDVSITGTRSFFHIATAVTAGLTGKFVCVDSAGGITACNAGTAGITTTPFHKNETIGIVKSITGNTVEIVGSGYFDEFAGLTAGQAYFLDPTVPGGYTTGIPAVTGQTKKRLFISTLGTTTGVIQIGDSNIVS